LIYNNIIFLNIRYQNFEKKIEIKIINCEEHLPKSNTKKKWTQQYKKKKKTIKWLKIVLSYHLADWDCRESLTNYVCTFRTYSWVIGVNYFSVFLCRIQSVINGIKETEVLLKVLPWLHDLSIK